MSREVPSWTQAEFVAFLSQLELKFALALYATVNPTPSASPKTETEEIDAAQDIFESALRSIHHYQELKILPVAESANISEDDDVIFPPFLYAALDYCLDAPAVCLGAYHLSTGKYWYDSKVVSWPRSLLWETESKIKLFEDLRSLYYKGKRLQPILSEPRTRAAQLLAISKHLVQKEKRRASR